MEAVEIGLAEFRLYGETVAKYRNVWVLTCEKQIPTRIEFSQRFLSCHVRNEFH